MGGNHSQAEFGPGSITQHLCDPVSGPVRSLIQYLKVAREEHVLKRNLGKTGVWFVLSISIIIVIILTRVDREVCLLVCLRAGMVLTDFYTQY